jgi:hypothetical protein
MRLPRLRAYVIQWLASRRGVQRGEWRGLDPRRVHFSCGCSILTPHARARRVALVTYNPAARSWVCPEHRRHLGDGSNL